MWVSMAKEKSETGKDNVGRESVFSKEALINSKRYRQQRDLLAALLEDEQQYSLAQTDEYIQKFMKGRN